MSNSDTMNTVGADGMIQIATAGGVPVLVSGVVIVDPVTGRATASGSGTPFSSALTSDGTSGGTWPIAPASADPTRRYIAAAADTILCIESITLAMTAAAAFDFADFGAEAAALADGLTILVTDAAFATEATPLPGPFKRNDELMTVANAVQYLNDGTNYMLRVTFEFAAPVVITAGNRLVLTLSDVLASTTIRSAASGRLLT